SDSPERRRSPRSILMSPRSIRLRLLALFAVAFTFALAVVFATPASAASYVPISGAGSTWSQTAIKAWDANVAQYSMTVNYAGGGSTVGRNDFRQGTGDWAGSGIPH